MHIYKSIKEGIGILKFNRQVIRKLAHEKKLEDIFLSNLFLNYIIVMVLFLIFLVDNNLIIFDKPLNKTVVFSILLIYPFIYNLVIYFIFWLFGMLSEGLYKVNKVKPVISIGFHVSIVYSIFVYILILLSFINSKLALFLFLPLLVYFIISKFVILKTVYELTDLEVTIVLLVFFLIISLIGIAYALINPLFFYFSI